MIFRFSVVVTIDLVVLAFLRKQWFKAPSVDPASRPSHTFTGKKDLEAELPRKGVPHLSYPRTQCTVHGARCTVHGNFVSEHAKQELG